MNTLAKLVRELGREFRERWIESDDEVVSTLARSDFDRIVAQYAKPAKRIPAKNYMKPIRRAKKDLYPRPDAGDAITIYPDGREVCNDNGAGRKEYALRKVDMYWRSKGLCCICGKHLTLEEATFEHKDGRGMGGGRRDDRVEFNGVAHLSCNVAKGSKR